MKVLTRQAFLALPAYTLYAKGGRWFFGELCLKRETLPPRGDYPGDWYYQDFAWIETASGDAAGAFDTLEEMLEHGTSAPMQTASTRDGLFELDELFLVFEREDLRRIAALLTDALSAVDDPKV